MYLVVGLGNPGRKYETTRHNIGFMIVDTIASKYAVKINKIKHKALIGQWNYGEKSILLAKPQTFMNLSGDSVREIVSYYNIEMSNVIVIYDDVDISFGKFRIRKKGSSGSHNGMKSVIYQLQDEDFPRIRIGIGADYNEQLHEYVLTDFKKDEVPIIMEVTEKIVDAVCSIIDDGIENAMNKFNRQENIIGE